MSTGNSADDARSTVVEGVVSVFSSLWVFLIVFGTVLAALGAFATKDVVAGMFGIWGATAVVVGCIGYAVGWYARP